MNNIYMHNRSSTNSTAEILVILANDALLLTDVFETFRDACIQNNHLDPAHF